MSEKLLLSAASVAEILDFETVEQVYAAAARGQLGPVVKIGRRVRFHAEFIRGLAKPRTTGGSVAGGKAVHPLQAK